MTFIFLFPVLHDYADSGDIIITITKGYLPVPISSDSFIAIVVVK
jgi:hypothetical protein